jgi:hypothetical protein
VVGSMASSVLGASMAGSLEPPTAGAKRRL